MHLLSSTGGLSTAPLHRGLEPPVGRTLQTTRRTPSARAATPRCTSASRRVVSQVAKSQREGRRRRRRLHCVRRVSNDRAPPSTCRSPVHRALADVRCVGDVPWSQRSERCCGGDVRAATSLRSGDKRSLLPHTTRAGRLQVRAKRCPPQMPRRGAGQMERGDGCSQVEYTTTVNVAERGGTPPAP